MESHIQVFACASCVLLDVAFFMLFVWIYLSRFFLVFFSVFFVRTRVFRQHGWIYELSQLLGLTDISSFFIDWIFRFALTLTLFYYIFAFSTSRGRKKTQYNVNSKNHLQLEVEDINYNDVIFWKIVFSIGIKCSDEALFNFRIEIYSIWIQLWTSIKILFNCASLFIKFTMQTVRFRCKKPNCVW